VRAVTHSPPPVHNVRNRWHQSADCAITRDREARLSLSVGVVLVSLGLGVAARAEDPDTAEVVRRNFIADKVPDSRAEITMTSSARVGLDANVRR